MDQIPRAPPVLKEPDSKKYTQLPYKPTATPELIPKRFTISDVLKYDGTLDSQEHITTNTTTMMGNDLLPHEIESVLLKKFGEARTKGALTWYSLLPENSIDSFQMLVDSFIKAHAGARKVQARKANIFRIAQGESELLQKFVTRFQKERMLLPAIPDEWAAEAFTKGLNPRSFDASQKLKESLLKFQATIWADFHNRYESKISIEDDQLGFPTSVKGRDREKNKDKSKEDFDMDRRGFRSADRFVTDKKIDRGRNNRSLQDKKTSGSRDSSYPRLSEYNFNVSVVELVSSMRNIKEVWFPKPMKSDPSQRGPNLWCEYHGTNGHWTGDCRHLREEVATLLKNGHLREFLSDRTKNNYGRNRDNMKPPKAGEDPPRLTIYIIFGGNEINRVIFSAVKKTKVSVTHSKRLREVAEDDITFIEEDADGLFLPHNDALVISLNDLDFKIKRVLVDPESSDNIIQWRVLEQDKLTGSIIPSIKLLVGFSLVRVTTTEERSCCLRMSKG
ncbi:uncharacterized protein LOC142177379 [Nicotiana tabacum]|uniref:Uncharacterized protein LOC142177379 n=1 Tax=Nicotiana tabacum TaxID=4097 RepID=A0AC58TXM0_TOBAC